MVCKRETLCEEVLRTALSLTSIAAIAKATCSVGIQSCDGHRLDHQNLSLPPSFALPPRGEITPHFIGVMLVAEEARCRDVDPAAAHL